MMTAKQAVKLTLQYANSECFHLLSKIDNAIQKAASNGFTNTSIGLSNHSYNEIHAVAEFYVHHGFRVSVNDKTLNICWSNSKYDVIYWGHENGPR